MYFFFCVLEKLTFFCQCSIIGVTEMTEVFRVKIQNLKYTFRAIFFAIPISLCGCKQEPKMIDVSLEQEMFDMQNTELDVEEQIESKQEEDLPLQEHSYYIYLFEDHSTAQIRISDSLTEKQFLELLDELCNLPKTLETLYISSYLMNEKGGICDYSKETQEKFGNFISSFPDLTSLSITGCGLEDISFISHLSQLKNLSLSGNHISNIDAISNLTNLEFLSFSDNHISDLQSISSFVNLKTLFLDFNPIIDLEPLKSLIQLKTLQINNCDTISDISPLSSLENLVTLNLASNQISDSTPLVQLKKLTQLNVSNNQISDISNFSNLVNLEFLDISMNLLTDIDSIRYLTKLNHLNLAYNSELSNLNSLSNLNCLIYLNILEIQEDSDLAFLKELKNLEYLYWSPYGHTGYSELIDSNLSKNKILTINDEIVIDINTYFSQDHFQSKTK